MLVHSSPLLILPPLLQWKSDLLRGVASLQGDSLEVVSLQGDSLEVVSFQGDSLEVVSFQGDSLEVASLQVDSLEVDYYLRSSEIWQHKWSFIGVTL